MTSISLSLTLESFSSLYLCSSSSLSMRLIREGDLPSFRRKDLEHIPCGIHHYSVSKIAFKSFVLFATLSSAPSSLYLGKRKFSFG